jgi:hypothetical protein
MQDPASVAGGCHGGMLAPLEPGCAPSDLGGLVAHIGGLIGPNRGGIWAKGGD